MVGMYTLLLISVAVFSAAFLLYWKITQDRIRQLQGTIEKQERLLKKNLPEVREEYARVFSELQKAGGRSAKEILGV